MALDFNPLLKDGFENNPSADLSNYYTKAETDDLISRLKYLKQIDDLDVYKAQIGEIVQYTGATNSKYTRGYIYEWTGGLSYEDITIQAGKKDISFTFPNGTVEHGYEIETDLSPDKAKWYRSTDVVIEALDGGSYTNPNYWNIACNIFLRIGKAGDKVNYKDGNNYIWGQIESVNCTLFNSTPLTTGLYQYDITALNEQDALEKYIELCLNQGYERNQIQVGWCDIVSWNVLLDNGEHYKIKVAMPAGGYGDTFAKVLISPKGKRLYLREIGENTISTLHNVATFNCKTQYNKITNGEIVPLPYLDQLDNYWYADPEYNLPTTATITTLSEAITIRVPKIEYDENGNPIEPSTENGWQRINVQPSVLVWTEM